MTEDNINFDYIIRYIRRTIKNSEGQISEMERYAKENKVPISQPETIKLIELLIKIGDVKRVLEIGTAIGYSAIRMASAGDTVVDTIEISEDMAKVARKNIKEAGLSDKINLYEGDARDVLKSLDAKYDLVFIDAAKAQYNEYFEHGMRMLNKGGMIISDNILYKGMTATDELLLHRKITIVKRLRNYVDMLCSHPLLETDILPIGDGVALSVRVDD